MATRILELFGIFAPYWLYLFFPTSLLVAWGACAWRRVYPTRRAVALVLVPTLAAIFRFFLPYSATLDATLVVADVGALALLVVDFILVARLGREVSATRQAEEIASLGQPLDVEIVVKNASKKPVAFELVDDSNPFSVAIPAPESDSLLATDSIDDYDLAKPSSFFERLELPGQSQERLRYRLVWTQRGSYRFEFVALRFSGAMKLWKKYKTVPCASSFRVYPNLCQLTKMELVARKSRLFMLGVRRARRVGQDAEFERLRDYTLDDQYKFIDWKATARRSKLIVRDFQTTRNQRVILALDAGRMTMNRSNGILLFDSALNSLLALAYIALKQGDEVGLLVFSNRVKRFVAPKGGASQMNALIRAAFDVFPERVESRYDRAFTYLKSHSPKRALVVLATNALDERNATQIELCMTNLLGSHLPLGLFLRERSLFDAVERFDEFERRTREERALDPKAVEATNKLKLFERQYREADPVDEIERLYWRKDVDDDPAPEDLFFRAAAAADILNWRRKTLVSLEAKGALTIDVFAEDATAPLINKYLEIKARRLL